MAKQSLSARLDEFVEKIIRRRDFLLSGAETDLTGLLYIAAQLRDLPREEFKRNLKVELERKAAMKTTAVSAIPEGFHSITPYLIVPGAAELMEFVKQAFGATEMVRVKRPDGKIMHAAVRIGDSMLEMADSTEEIAPMVVPIHLYVKDADAVYRRAVAAGGVSIEDPIDQPYGDREAGVKDASGNEWYIATHKPTGLAPAGLRSVTPYLHVRGAGEMIEFLKAALSAEEAGVDRAPDGTIVHAKVRIGDSILEMGEAHGPYQPKPASIHLYVDDTDALYAQAVKAGAVSLRKPTDEPYGDRVAGVSDPAGNSWWITTHIRDVH